MIKYTLFIVLSLSILYSCDSLFEKTISLDDIHKEQLAVTAILSNQDSVHQIFLTNTIGATDQPKYDTVNTATVSLENNGNIVRFVHNEQSGFYEYAPTVDFKVGEEWQLNVESTTFGIVNAVQFVPPSLGEINVDASDLSIEDQQFPETGIFSVFIEDKNNTKNYYIIELEAIGIGTNYETFETERVRTNCFISGNTSIIDYNGSRRVYLTNENRSGEQIKLQINYWSTLDEIEEMQLKITSTTKEGYLYHLTTDKFRNTSSNPFAEPVTLFSNIEEGTGVFSIENVRTITLEQ